MRLTPFGKQVRTYRLDANVTLSDMAHALKVTPAYLSAVETGRKPPNDELVRRIVAYLQTLNTDAHGLFALAHVNGKELPLDDLDEDERQAVVAFARRLPDLPRSQRREAIRKLLDFE
jgi:transcriptional regulator with XRE-family HTH domain